MAAPTGDSGGPSAPGPSAANARRSNRGSSGHGRHPRPCGTRILLAKDACRRGSGLCDCLLLKKRRGRPEPLHQYIVGVPMGRLAMDVVGPYPITSSGNQYCLMVGCYFSKWLECFPIPDQKARTVARKLVYEIVARYGAFRELQ